MSAQVRCQWAKNPMFHTYHDEEWGVPIHDDQRLFEFLILEGAQAGLSWSTILKRREGYREAFAQFDPQKVSLFDTQKEQELATNPAIIRNKAKIRSTIRAAKLVLELQKEFGSFDHYLWQFVGGQPKVNHWKEMADIPATSPEAEKLSQDLKQRGFNFVGPTIMYAFMQAVGMVNDHQVNCFRYTQVSELKK